MMTHRELVKALVKDGRTISEEMNGNKAHIIHMILGVAGEVGELLDAIKKAAIYNKPLDMENVIEEFGDIEFYLEGLRQGLGVTREETLEVNITKLTKRYGAVYSDQAAITRADKA